MAPERCVLAALSVAALFAVVSGCENCPPTLNAATMKLSGNNSSGGAHTDVDVLCAAGPSTCPRDTLKLAACSGFLNGWMNFSTGMPPRAQCCAVVDGYADFEVAVCLCTALRANIMGFNLNIPIAFTKLINTCSKNVPDGFICK
ncbi:Hydrophobic seed protein [Vigna unguiculata]|uniref:Hydrophobic seed protein n=1 Tax=Vigna unguiculata TaxID=3917 RepID=A0A4D6N534_VIGUN|nr:Hydrophobic seed protein [Vigna unguiculata]